MGLNGVHAPSSNLRAGTRGLGEARKLYTWPTPSSYGIPAIVPGRVRRELEVDQRRVDRGPRIPKEIPTPSKLTDDEGGDMVTQLG